MKYFVFKLLIFLFLRLGLGLKIRMGSLMAALQAINSINQTIPQNNTKNSTDGNSVFSFLKQKKGNSTLNETLITNSSENIPKTEPVFNGTKEIINELDQKSNLLLIGESTGILNQHVDFLKGKKNTTEYFGDLNSTIERVRKSLQKMRMLQHVISNSLKPSSPEENLLEKKYYSILANADKETSSEVLKYKIMELFFPEESPLIVENERHELSLAKTENVTLSRNETTKKNSSKNDSGLGPYNDNSTVSIEDLLQSDIPSDHKISPLEALLRNQAHLQMEALKFREKSEAEKKAETELEAIPAIEQNLALMNEEAQMENDMISMQEEKTPDAFIEDY